MSVNSNPFRDIQDHLSGVDTQLETLSGVNRGDYILVQIDNRTGKYETHSTASFREHLWAYIKSKFVHRNRNDYLTLTGLVGQQAKQQLLVKLTANFNSISEEFVSLNTNKTYHRSINNIYQTRANINTRLTGIKRKINALSRDFFTSPQLDSNKQAAVHAEDNIEARWRQTQENIDKYTSIIYYINHLPEANKLFPPFDPSTNRLVTTKSLKTTFEDFQKTTKKTLEIREFVSEAEFSKIREELNNIPRTLITKFYRNIEDQEAIVQRDIKGFNLIQCESYKKYFLELREDLEGMKSDENGAFHPILEELIKLTNKFQLSIHKRTVTLKLEEIQNKLTAAQAKRINFSTSSIEDLNRLKAPYIADREKIIGDRDAQKELLTTAFGNRSRYSRNFEAEIEALEGDIETAFSEYARKFDQIIGNFDNHIQIKVKKQEEEIAYQHLTQEIRELIQQLPRFEKIKTLDGFISKSIEPNLIKFKLIFDKIEKAKSHESHRSEVDGLESMVLKQQKEYIKSFNSVFKELNRQLSMIQMIEESALVGTIDKLFDKIKSQSSLTLLQRYEVIKGEYQNYFNEHSTELQRLISSPAIASNQELKKVLSNLLQQFNDFDDKLDREIQRQQDATRRQQVEKDQAKVTKDYARTAKKPKKKKKTRGELLATGLGILHTTLKPNVQVTKSESSLDKDMEKTWKEGTEGSSVDLLKTGKETLDTLKKGVLAKGKSIKERLKKPILAPIPAITRDHPEFQTFQNKLGDIWGKYPEILKVFSTYLAKNGHVINIGFIENLKKTIDLLEHYQTRVNPSIMPTKPAESTSSKFFGSIKSMLKKPQSLDEDFATPITKKMKTDLQQLFTELTALNTELTALHKERQK